MRSYDGKDLGGDGTVPRVSASPQEAKSDQDAMFSSDKHGSLQNADGVHTQMRGWINEIDLGDFLAVTPEHVAVAPPTRASSRAAGVRAAYAVRPVNRLVAFTDLGWRTNSTSLAFGNPRPVSRRRCDGYRVRPEGSGCIPVASRG